MYVQTVIKSEVEVYLFSKKKFNTIKQDVGQTFENQL